MRTFSHKNIKVHRENADSFFRVRSCQFVGRKRPTNVHEFFINL